MSLKTLGTMQLLTFLLEDNQVMTDQLISTLHDVVGGVKVVFVAKKEFEAVSWLEGHAQWNLAIVDLFLLEGSGLGVLAALQNRNAHQRVVVLSNYITPVVTEKCITLGADKVFDKSMDLEDFLSYCIECKTSLKL